MAAALSNTTAGAAPDLTNEAIVRRAIEAIWNAGDLDLADDLFAADYVNHRRSSDLVKRPEAVKVSVAMYRLAFPDFSVDVEELSRKKTELCSAGPLEADPLDHHHTTNARPINV